MVAGVKIFSPSWSPCVHVQRSSCWATSASSSGSVAEAIWPRVETATSRAASDPMRETSMRQSNPSGSKTGSTALPTPAAME